MYNNYICLSMQISCGALLYILMHIQELKGRKSAGKWKSAEIIITNPADHAQKLMLHNNY